ncbi:MAG: MBL fold metallo-hydrolase [Pseudomonadota bacterium]
MRIVLSALVVSLLVGPALAQDLPSTDVETVDLGNGVYALITNRAGNVGVLAGDDGVFMVDTQMAPFAPALDEAQRAVSGGDVNIVLNTHLHGDHVLGNRYFAEQGAIVLAHPNVRPGLVTPATSQLSGRTPDPLGEGFLADVEVTSGDAVTLNGITARLYHEPDAHTDGDIWVHFEEADVIHTGDLLFSGFFPYIDLDNGGTVQGFIAAMQSIVDVAGQDTVIISGHGPISSEADLEASIAMLEASYERIEELVKGGLSLDDIQAEDPLADFTPDWNWSFITTERMVWTIYRDLTGKTV